MKSKLVLLALALSAPAFGQLASEDFSVGNTDDWGIEYLIPGVWMPAGGNPGGMIQLDFTNTVLSLPSALIMPRAAGHPWSGDFATMQVSAFSYDREVLAGRSNFGTFMTLVLANDNGTPTNFADDSMVFTEVGVPLIWDRLPWGYDGWKTITTNIPSQELLIPADWDSECLPSSPYAGSSDDVVWDAVIHNVSYVALSTGRPWGGGVWFGYHTINFDNFVLEGGVVVGTRFCDPANLNSTGQSTNLVGNFLTGGGISGGMSDLHLECTNGVPSQLGYFLVGSTPTAGFPVSNGLLCLTGGPFYRYNVAGTTSNSVGLFNAAGVLRNYSGTSTVGPVGMETGFDVPDTVASTPQVITAGSTWHFQVWHRDTPAGVGVSNFSNGLSVTF